jgi:hypothetical protein
MKIFRRIVYAVVLLVVVAVLIVYFNLNRVVKRTVESQATTSLNLNTTLNSAHLSLFGGKLDLNELQIASPPGFSAPHMLELGDTNVAVKYGELRKDPVHIESLTLDKPKLVIEQSNGTLNFKKAMDLMPPSDSSSQKESKKLIINELRVKDAQVVIHPNLPGVPSELTVPVPSILMKDVGTGDGSQNGAAIKDVVMQVVTALAGSASDSGAIPEQLKALLKLNVGQVLANLGPEVQKRIAAAIPGEFGQKLSEIVKDPQALLKDPSKAIQQNIGNLINGGNSSGSTTQPSVQDTAKGAVNQLEGLLGGKKKDGSK